MTDRRGAGYLLRFASRLPAGAPDALDSGTLSVARVEGDQVRWLDLPEDRATVMDTAAAAGRRGGTTFDRPSGLAVSGPGPLLMACRGAAGSSFGHVLEFQPASGDHAAEARLCGSDVERQLVSVERHPGLEPKRVARGESRGGEPERRPGRDQGVVFAPVAVDDEHPAGQPAGLAPVLDEEAGQRLGADR
ncbi:MAG: DUF839 domain-containing protein, partial ['Waltheria sp.' little leaf phytoplasma]|nr:DUF839 domain-containing protein ['Waltheria sp.' little leaf phytoplasma]